LFTESVVNSGARGDHGSSERTTAAHGGPAHLRFPAEARRSADL